MYTGEQYLSRNLTMDAGSNRPIRYTEKGKEFWKGIRIQKTLNPAVAKDLRKNSGRKPNKKRYIKKTRNTSGINEDILTS